MTCQVDIELRSRIVGDYVDEADCPTHVASRRAEIVPTQLIASHVGLWGRDGDLKRFTVLFRDGRVAAVRGHGLKHEPHPVAGQDVFSIFVQAATEEVTVALFKSSDVAGIFHGDLGGDGSTKPAVPLVGEGEAAPSHPTTAGPG